LGALSRKLEQNVRKIIKDSVKHFSKDRGNLPSHIAELIEQALGPPKVPYYQIIRRLVRGSRLSKFQRSPTRINRKRTYTFHLEGSSLPQISPFPGKKRDFTFDIVILIDTSGSMSPDQIAEGLSGVKNIIENDKYCYTTVLEVDAGVEKEYQCKRIKDIQFNVKGRGGTVLRPGLERAKQLGCDICLAFSDGYVDDINSVPRKYLPKKLVWIITENGSVEHVNKSGYVIKL
jgi:predicted metal-dependent peptidase